MPRPKKTELSDAAAGAMKKPTKRGNPDFVSSSFYVPKKVNIRFDKAILTLKAEGFDIDRSDILSVLMDRFGIAVDAAEKSGMTVDFKAILETASDGVMTDAADVSVLKAVMRESIATIKAEGEELKTGYRELKADVKKDADVSQEEIAQLKSTYESVIEQMLRFVPDNEDRRIVEEILASLKG